jgi:hypothetical protein
MSTVIMASSLSGVMVIMLITGPKVRGFKPGRPDRISTAIKISNTPFFGSEAVGPRSQDTACKKKNYFGKYE